MRSLAGLEWGASVSALKYLCIALIRSKLDYGSVAYGSAAKTALAELDIVQACALRICLGRLNFPSMCTSAGGR